MGEIRKGTGNKPAPKHQINYTRVEWLCLIISIISVIGFVIAYRFKSVGFIAFTAGTLIASLAIHMALNPLESEDNDDC